MNYQNFVPFPYPYPTENNFCSMNMLKLYYPTLKEYGGLLNSYEDVYKVMKYNVEPLCLIAHDLYVTDVRKIFTDEKLEYIKNAICIYAKVCNSPCKLKPYWEELNPEYNIYTKILEKYGWNEPKTE